MMNGCMKYAMAGFEGEVKEECDWLQGVSAVQKGTMRHRSIVGMAHFLGATGAPV